MLDDLKESGFWELNNTYSMSPSDLDATRITVTWEGQRKSILNYWTGGEMESWLRIAPQLADEDWESHYRIQAMRDRILKQADVEEFL